MPPWISNIWDDYFLRLKQQATYFAFVLEPARPHVPVITENDVIEAYDLLQKANTLHDLGFGGLTWWRCKATCSRHGMLVRYEETVGGPPSWQTLRCKPCSMEGVRRSCPIEELEVVVGQQLPIVGPEEK